MSEPIKFYFDFSSPYAYFASFKIDEASKALDREVIWKPFLLGVLFQITGSPYFIVDGEGFWGSDRMWMIRRWIERGGW